MNAGMRARQSLLWTLLLGGCAPASRDATQVMVVVDAEPSVRNQMAMLELGVQGIPDSAMPYSKKLLVSTEQVVGPDTLVLPYTLALAPKGGDETRRFQVLVRAWNATGAIVAQARVLSHFVAHQRLLLPLVLRDDCISLVCDSEETCLEGHCTSASVDPASLQRFTGNEPEPATQWTPDASVQPEPDQDSGSEPIKPVEPTCPNGQCPCENGSQRTCGVKIGACQFGVQQCVDNRWQSCVGQRSATPEICNGIDDDCNGNVDDYAVCNPLELAHTRTAVCEANACRPTRCEPFFDNCNQDGEITSSDGCEQSLTTNEHCGACNTPCTIDNAVASCETGVCLVTDCDTDWKDCDDDGTSCETSMSTVQNCGGCNVACGFDHASARCGGPVGNHSCQIDQCNAGWDDCNSDKHDGCEIELATDAHNCGACDNDCVAKPNVDSASCSSGTCSVVCKENFVDCDGNPNNGCEVDLSIGTCARCLTRTSNVDASLQSYNASVIVDFSCGGTHVFDSTSKLWTPADCCGGPCPEPIGPVNQFVGSSVAPQVVILRAVSLHIAAGDTVALVGQYPVVLAVKGNATIEGTIDASAAFEIAGAGGNTTGCSGSTGQAGVAQVGNTESSGGGGGGFSSSGGLPGASPSLSRSGGGPHGDADVSPLYGGCAGGLGHIDVACTTGSQLAGAGAGGVQLAIAGKLTLTGTLIANGGVGGAGCPTTSRSGGSGGGSGGAFLLEASAFDVGVLGQRTQVFGGNGGASSSGAAGGQGAQQSGATSGVFLLPAGGGGGGGSGRVFMRNCLN